MGRDAGPGVRPPEFSQPVDSLILVNTLADTQPAYESTRGVLDELPPEDQETIDHYAGRREFDAAEYEAALHWAYREHVCRFDERPGPVRHRVENINMEVYGLM